MQPFPILLALFFIVPIVEIYLLIQFGSAFGVWLTIFAVVLTAVIGAWLLRQQGISTFSRMQQNLAQGSAPHIELMEGLFLVFGGALLMTPGFVTDAIGFCCLIPISRQALVKLGMRYFISRGASAFYSQSAGQSGFNHSAEPTRRDGSVIEGEVVSSAEEKPPTNQ